VSGYSQYPVSIDSYTYRRNIVDNVDAFDVNELQDGIESIQSTLGINPQGALADVSTRLAVSVDPSGNIITPSTTSEYFQIDSDGTSSTPYLSFGGGYDERLTWSNPNSRFELTGSLYIAGDLSFTGTISTADRAYFANGTLNEPSITFAADTTLGFYRIGVSNLGICAAGNKILDLGTADVIINDENDDLDVTIKGTADSQLFKCDAGTDTVLLGSNANTTDFANAQTISSHGDTGHTSATANIGVAGEAVAGVSNNGWGGYFVGRTNGIRLGAGVRGIGLVTATGDTSRAYGGWFQSIETHAGGKNIAVYANAVNGADNYSFYGESGQMVQADGTVGIPAYSFTSDLDTGIYREGANIMGFSAGGTEIASIGTTGLSILNSTRLFLEDGSAAAPPITFNNDTDTGMYRIGANNLGFSVAGAKIAEFETNGITINNAGSAAHPSLWFTDDTDTGLYKVGANWLGIAANGQLQMSIGDGYITLGNANYDRMEITDDGTSRGVLTKGGDDDQLSINFNAYTSGIWHVYDTTRHSWNTSIFGSTGDAYVSWGVAQPTVGIPSFTTVGKLSEAGNFTVGNGTVGAPSHSFISDTDTGIYRIGANNLGISCSATKILDMTSSKITAIVQQQSSDGSLGSPGIAVGKSSTGFYKPSSSVINVAIDNVISGQFSSGQMVAPVGGVSTPGLSFIGDTDTGAYRIGANNIGIACNGAKVVDVSTSGAEVTGAITYASAQTRYYTIPGNAFIMGSETTNNPARDPVDGFIVWGNAGYALAPIHLPHGAIITRIDGYFFVGAAISSFGAYYKAFSSNYDTNGTLIAGDGTAVAGEQTLSLTGLSSTIDNSANYYWIYVQKAGSGNDHVEGVKITYTITTPLP